MTHLDLNHLSIIKDAFLTIFSQHRLAFCVVLGVVILRALIGNPRHFFNVRKASRSLKTLRAIDDPARQFGYLRCVDPFVFEEMILTALQEMGHGIRRSRRYTGDGGIDGRAIINGEKVLIQAKRYRQHITAEHVSAFAHLCRRSGKKGIFIHTGKTGKQSWVNGAEGHIDIVSGSRMLNLLTGTYIPKWEENNRLRPSTSNTVNRAGR